MVEPPVVPVDLDEPDPTVLERAARLLHEGELVAGPSDTVYGLLALPRSERGRNALAAIKGRPGPFIVLIRTFEEARGWTRGVEESVWSRLHRVWPGPVTVILPTTPDMPGAEAGGIGLRMPLSPFLHLLLDAVGEPLFSTSANRPGDPPPLAAAEAAAVFEAGEVALVLDGGPSTSRLPSTILDWRGESPSLVREGRGDVRALLDRGEGPP